MGLFSKLKKDKGGAAKAAPTGAAPAPVAAVQPPPAPAAVPAPAPKVRDAEVKPPPKAAAAPDPAAKIAALQKQIDLLDKREEMLQKKIEIEVDKAKQAMARGEAGKPRALEHLGQKQQLMAQKARIAGQRKNLTKQRMAMEEAIMINGQIDTTKDGVEALTKMQDGMSTEMVDDLMADLDEQLDLGKSVAEALGQGTMGGDYVDEGLAEDELAALMELDAQEKLMGEHAADLPAAKGTAAGPSSAKPKSREDELAALEATLM